MTARSPLAALARLAAAVAPLALAAGSAQAVDWTGYFRAGPGLTSTDNASRACYGLGGGSAGMKYRLGNECDFYGEFQLAQGFQKDGIDYKVSLMTSHYTGATDTDGEGLSIAQMWAEAKGFDIAPDATFWIGKERGRRGDVHIVDTFFVEMVGVGAGFKNQPLGAGKLGVAFYKTDADAAKPGNRVNVEYLGLPTGADGALNIFATATKGDFTGGKSGFGLTLRHDQGKLFGTGLSNTLFVQYAQGSTALNTAQARKRARQAVKQNAHNSSLRSELRTAIKKVIKAIEAGDKAAAQSVFQASVSAVDGIADKKIIHKNKAARHKDCRLSAAIKAMA